MNFSQSTAPFRVCAGRARKTTGAGISAVCGCAEKPRRAPVAPPSRSPVAAGGGDCFFSNPQTPGVIYP